MGKKEFYIAPQMTANSFKWENALLQTSFNGGHAAGREEKVKKFFLRSSLFMNLKGILEASSETNKEMPETLRKVGEKERFLLLHKYMESLVAFQRFYGGKDS